MIGGRLALMLYPPVLSELATGRSVVLVSGTNGKTTTTAMTAAVLATAGPVASNATGANMLDGLTATMATSSATTVIAEVDELYLPEAVAQTRPCLLVLLNLSRDQLDRAAEIHTTAARLRALAAAHPALRVVANADDPYVAHVAAELTNVVWVAAGSSWRGDTGTCPACGARLAWRGSAWSCAGCGNTRPRPDWWLAPGRPGPASTVLTGATGSVALAVHLPGRVNEANAAMALATGQALGVDLDEAAAAVATVREVAGRYRVYHLGGRAVRLILAKNPAGWAATLEMIPPSTPVVIAINGAEADGRDTSWLYDVCFERLTGRAVTASGDRAADLGVRLSYAEIAHDTTPDPLDAILEAPPGPVTLAADYTSFARLRTKLERAR
jgi:UDP-N-acetylmuramyl tripeptide synthase